MSLYGLSDLHLSFGTNKPMNIFKGWDNYTERIEANWHRIVKPQDTVVIPGDFSWALKLEETREDFKFLESLPGRKILLKGNHDLWWSTATKVKEFLKQNEINSVEIIFNDCLVAEGTAIAGTRGWFFDDTGDKKVLLREAGRLEASIKAAEKTGLPVIVFLHYPPVYAGAVCEEIFDVIRRHGIKKVYHGHIHGSGFHKAVSSFEGVRLNLISCDCVEFTPVMIR